MNSDKVAILGSGSWGTAFACILANKFQSVCMWAHSNEVCEGINTNHKNPRYLSDVLLPENITATTSFEEALVGCKWIVEVIPSAYLRDTMREAAPFIDDTSNILVLTKGVEAHSFKFMCDVVADEVGNSQRIAVLTGPNHAEEISRGKISAAVISANNIELSKAWQEKVCSKHFRAYISDDLVGTEICSATKNIIAIACGAASALDVGDNCLSVLMTRGLAEMGRIVSACGADPLTCMGMAGMGDLLATCTSPHSRNRSFGEALIKGETLEEYEKKTHMVVEGAKAASSVYEMAKLYDIEIPITKAVWSMLYTDIDAQVAIDSLLERLPEEEFYDFK